MRPRPYLSWTQHDLIEKSEDRYVDVYIEGKAMRTNKGMGFGRKVADALDERKKGGEVITGDPAFDYVVSKMPTYGNPEVEIETTLNDVPLFGKIDDLCPNFTGLYEHKTGIGRWTQHKADTHGQIDFYCTLIYGLKKIPPEKLDLKLVYLPTQYSDTGEIEVTGEDPIVFTTKRTMADVLAMSARQKRAWKRIGELTEKSLL